MPMMLYDTEGAPNPRRVRIFLAEKGIDVPREQVNLMRAEHKRDAFRALNPMQRTPVLLLDDGTVLAESVAICRYFDELKPEPPLFDEGILGRALVEMWQRRIEWHLLVPVLMAFRHGHRAMRELEQPQLPDVAEKGKINALEFMSYLDSELAERTFIAGENFSIADITALVAIDFLKAARIAMPDLANLARWHGAVSRRPGAVP